MKRKNTKGFTLIEIIVVLIIIAILAAIAVPALMKYIEDAKEKQILAEVRSVYIAAQAAFTEAYAADIPASNIFQLTRPHQSANINNGEPYYSFNEGNELWTRIEELAPVLLTKNVIAMAPNVDNYNVCGSYESGVLSATYMKPDSNAEGGYICYIYIPGQLMQKLSVTEAVTLYGFDTGGF